MIETAAAPSAPAPSAPSAPANDNAAPAPAAVSEAAKTLAASRQAYKDKLAKPAEKPPEAKPAPQEAKPAEPSVDEVQALIREDRRIKAERQKLEADRAAIAELEPEVKALRAAKQMLANGDRVGAVRAAFPDLTDDLFWDLAKSIGEKGEGEEGVDIDAKVDQAFTAREEARAKAERERVEKEQAAHRAELAKFDEKLDAPGFCHAVMELTGCKDQPMDTQRAVAEAYTEFVEASASLFSVHKDKLPGIKEFGATPIEVIRKAEKLRAELKRQPSTAEVLNAIEADITARVERIAPRQAAAPEPRPSATVTSSWRSDPGRPSTPEKADKTLEEIREERRAALRKPAVSR